MMTSKLRESFQLTVFVLLTSVLAAGCGGGVSIEEVCSKCDKDSTSIAACIKSEEKQKESIESIGCGSEFQSFLDCAFDKGTCTEQKTLNSDGCEPERIDVLRCAGAL